MPYQCTRGSSSSPLAQLASSCIPRYPPTSMEEPLVPRVKEGPLTKKHWYIIAKQLHLGFTWTSQGKTAFIYDFCGGFSLFLVYFSLFWIKFPPNCKIRVHIHVKNASQQSLAAAYFMLFGVQMPHSNPIRG
jgi:hypothetical protein